MVASVRPLPAGISGALRPVDFQATVVGDVATTTYVADEDETFHGAQIRRPLPDGRHMGAPQRDLEAALTAEQRKAYCGRYTLGDLTYVVRCEPDGLTGGSPGKPSKPLRVETPDVLFVPGEPRLRYLFQRDASGRVTGFLQRRESWDLAWKRVD